jgi:hypothetical protein
MWLVVTALVGCAPGFDDGLYFGWDDRRVLCAEVIDDRNALIDMRKLSDRMDDARTHREVFDLYAHIPGQTIDRSMIERVLRSAERRQLDYVTYHDMLDVANPRPGLALAFDDDTVDAWLTIRDMLNSHHARVTFFITGYAAMSAEQKAGIQLLAADGHDIEAHGVNHLNAPDYVAAHGLEAYLNDEALPSISVLIADGYPVVAFAYPYGARSVETDQALLEHVDLIRTTAGPCPH